MSEFTIYHNPNCSKSRATLQILEENGIQPDVVKYLETPPSSDELKGILQKLGTPVESIIRKKEELFKQLGLESKGLTQEEWLHILEENPKLIERPIVIKGEKAVMGRPPENVFSLLKSA